MTESVRTLLAMGMLAGGVATAFTQRGLGHQGHAVIRTIEGSVTRIDSMPPGRGAGGGIHLQLKAGTDTFEVHLGPTAYLASKFMTITGGDRLKVTGTMMVGPHGQVFRAASVAKGAVIVQLRDSTGLPLWMGGRGMMKRPSP